MVVSQIGVLQYRPLKYSSPYYRDPQNGTPKFGKPPYRISGKENGSYYIVGVYRGYMGVVTV